MRRALVIVGALLMAQAAAAQQQAVDPYHYDNPAYHMQVATPTAPVAPTVAVPDAAAIANTTDATAADDATTTGGNNTTSVTISPPKSRNAQLTDQLHSLLKAKTDQQALGEALAMATLLNCAKTNAGGPATDAFYKQMQAVGKQIGDLCKQNRADDARALVLQTMKANQYNRVVMSLNNCYLAQKSSFEAMGGHELATDAARYARWIRDPYTAQREMQDSDICK